MKLYELKRTEEINYDECDGFVVSATSPKRARELANAEAGDEGSVWTDEKRASCELLGTAKNGTTEGVVLRSFNAG